MLQYQPTACFLVPVWLPRQPLNCTASYLLSLLHLGRTCWKGRIIHWLHRKSLNYVLGPLYKWYKTLITHIAASSNSDALNNCFHAVHNAVTKAKKQKNMMKELCSCTADLKFNPNWINFANITNDVISSMNVCSGLNRFRM